MASPKIPLSFFILTKELKAYPSCLNIATRFYSADPKILSTSIFVLSSSQVYSSIKDKRWG